MTDTTHPATSPVDALVVVADWSAGVAGVSLGWHPDWSGWELTSDEDAQFRAGYAAGLQHAARLLAGGRAQYADLLGSLVRLGERDIEYIDEGDEHFDTVGEFRAAVERVLQHPWAKPVS